MTFEKKLIQLFKTFVEKSFIPQIKRLQGSINEWNHFSSLLSADTINLTELQVFVDTLPSSLPSLTPFQKQPAQKKIQQNGDFQFGFNPNKTFGGQKNKAMFTPNEEADKRNSVKEEPLKNKGNILNSSSLCNLERLLRVLEQNQQIIENMGKENGRRNVNSQRIIRNETGDQFIQSSHPQRSYQGNYH